MPFRSRRVHLLVGALVLVSIPIPAWARLTQSDLVLVRADDVIDEDLYAAGNRVNVEGRIEGDLVAVAFDDIVITGEVTGDVLAVAGRVVINGTVGGAVRAAAGQVEVGGVVGDDLVVAAWNTVLTGSGQVGRDLINWGRNGQVEGAVGRDLGGRYTRLVLDGQVEGAVDVNVANLVVGSTARVEGDIAYRSTRQAEINSELVGGSVIQRTPLPPNIRVRALLLLTLGLVVLVLTAAGLALAATWPALLEAAIAAARRGFRTWLSGLGVIVSPVLAAGVLAALVAAAPTQAALPLAVVLLPIIFGLFGIVLFGSMLGVIPAAGAFGSLVLRQRRSAAASVLVGMALVGLLMLIPWVRWVTAALIIPLGSGSLLGGRLMPES
ncbi:MAG: hypothetical protein ACRDWH_04975 [Acidimicrobiia bacterium]